MLATAMRPIVSNSMLVRPSEATLVASPARAKKTGMKSATMRPRNCSSMCRVRMGDSPISTPATNAPRTVCTPIASVTSAIAPVITRMTVMTGSSLTE
jgi:hypothetical protein